MAEKERSERILTLGEVKDILERCKELPMEIYSGPEKDNPVEIEEVPEQKVRVAMFPVGETNLEFLEPTGPESPIAKFIEKKGSGIHHVAIQVEDIDRLLADLKSRGVRLINETPVPGAGGKRIAFVHPASTGGILLELSQKKKG